MKLTSKLPDRPVTKGRKGINRFPDGRILRFEIVDEICRPQSNEPQKLIYLQRVRFEDGRQELRLCYYIIGKLPRMKGRWVFGQYATFLPNKDFRAIVNEAKRKRWM